MIDDVDAWVRALHGEVAAPEAQQRDVVLVAGPWLAGTTSVAAALRERLPGRTIVEAADLADTEAPAAVVYVCSAVAPLTESDCVLLDSAAADTDLVIGAVSKIDVHRGWRDVLAADQKNLTAHDERYADMPWVGVAAAPVLGDTTIEDLARLLEEGLSLPGLARRNRLRAWHTRLASARSRHDDAAAAPGRKARIAALRQQRSEAVRRRRVARSERAIALRSRIQQAKVQMTYFARSRCATVRSELAEDAAAMTRRRITKFEEYVATRVGDVIDEVHDGIGTELSDLAKTSGLTAPQCEPAPVPPSVASPPLAAGGLEERLMMLLGLAFGLGVALTSSRLFADLAPAYTVVGLVAGAAVGLVVAVWVVAMRRVLRDRVVLDRWVGEVIGEVRAVVEQHVARQVLVAETELTAEHAQREEAEAADLAVRIASIDDELREHAVSAARAAAARDRELPALQRALDAVHAELARPN